MTRMMKLIAVTAVFAPAAVAQDTADVQRPGTSFLRFNEDWSSLRGVDLTQTGDPIDRIKYIPLDDAGDNWLSLGGHLRGRYEHWNNFAFGAPDPDRDGFLLWRLALHADLHLGENVRAFVEGKSADSTHRDLPGGRRSLDVDTLDLEQAFIDLSFDIGDDLRLTLRPGRQVFAFGKQRLVSPLPWANTLRRWDGISAIARTGDWTLTGFWTQFVPVQKYHFNDSDAQTQFFGIYATGKIPDTSIGLDLYALGLDRDDPVTFNGTTGDERRYTVGARVFGGIGDTGFDYDLEGAYQFGEVGSGDVNAFMIGSQLGYTFRESEWKPRVFAGFDYATGDKSPGGDVETFNHLFPLGHAYYGYADFVGRQNAIDVSFGAAVSPFDRCTLTGAVHLLWVDDETDALYNAGGGVVRGGLSGASRELGAEFDVTAKYVINRHLAAEAGYAYFIAGEFLDDTGASDDIQFAYLQLTFTF